MTSFHRALATLASGDLVATWSGEPAVSSTETFARLFSLGTQGVEDQPLTLPTITAAVADTDGSEILSVHLTGFPAGATFSKGHAGPGGWVIDNAADIASLATTPLTMAPPANYNGNFTLGVQAVVTDTATLTGGPAIDTASVTKTIDVTITPVADPIAPVNLANIAAGIGGFKIIAENAGDFLGTSTDSAGDMNGDGLADMLIGANQNDAGGADAGAVYVVFGKAGGAAVDLDTVAAGTGGGFKIYGESAGDWAGWFAAAHGDMNGDGLWDVVVGARGNGADDTGAAYVVFGKASTAPVNLDDVANGIGGFKIVGENAFDNAGNWVSAVSDVNGDGRTDLLVGAPFNAAGGGSSGAAYVVFGKGDGTTVNLANVAAGIGGFKIIGENGSDQAGWTVSRLSDINGDGRADLLVGAYGNDAGGTDSGAAYVVFGKASGTAVNLDDVAAGTGGFKIIGENAADQLSLWALSDLGDVNGDGRPDILVGGTQNDTVGTSSGAAYVVFGKTTGTAVNLDDVANGIGGFKIIAENGGDQLGVSASNLGDINGDGLADLLVGAWMNDAGGPDSGAAYVVFGKTGTGAINLDDVAAGIGGFKIIGENVTQLTSDSITGLGDVNGDGLTDMLIGAILDDAGGTDAGAGYVVFGRPEWLF
jgi:hypothetical protein